MSTRYVAAVPTAQASRYLQQLCKHWSHKFDVAFDADHGTVPLPGALLTLAAEDGTLAIALDVEDPAVGDQMKRVVAEHLDRFAFREAPLPFHWRTVE
ncbi:DUF2218 domain-containing protein [Sphingomonas sp. 1P06PA]|uniref:DUF2218 domain-containing protein n=1 Tax=Sphingomonas sp. 1P06PA TaxID=554121 RepID=UPI0039A45CCF